MPSSKPLSRWPARSHRPRAPKAVQRVAAIVAVIAAAFLVLSFLVPRTAPPSPAPLVGSSSPSTRSGACAGDVRGAAFAEGSMDERLAALRTWAASHRDQQATLVVTDAVLTQAALAQVGEGGAFPVRDVAVSIAPDGVHVSAVAVAGFLRFQIKATLVPEVRDGRVRFVVTELDTGSLPGPLRGPVNDAVTRAADPDNWRLPLRADDVVLRAGCGVVHGRA